MLGLSLAKWLVDLFIPGVNNLHWTDTSQAVCNSFIWKGYIKVKKQLKAADLGVEF